MSGVAMIKTVWRNAKALLTVGALCLGLALGAVAVVASIGATPAHAVQPDEILDDPELERRARKLSAELRCVVCQNESIDASNAPLARDLRILVRERLTAGDTDQEVLDFLVARYGEFVLLRPTFAPHTIALWLFSPLLLVIAGYFMFVRARRAAATRGDDPAAAVTESLTDEERAAIERVLAEARRTDTTEPKGSR